MMITSLEQQSIFTVDYDFGKPSDSRRDHNFAGGHGFEADHGHSFRTSIGQNARRNDDGIASRK